MGSPETHTHTQKTFPVKDSNAARLNTKGEQAGCHLGPSLLLQEVSSHASLQTVNAGEGVSKTGPSYTVGGNENCYSHYGEQCGDSLKKLQIELPNDPAIPLLGMHAENERNPCTPMFIAALFTVARTWKQPRCPSADEWIRKLWYIYTMEYYSDIIKSEVSQKEKHQYRILTHIYGI